MLCNLLNLHCVRIYVPTYLCTYIQTPTQIPGLSKWRRSAFPNFQLPPVASNFSLLPSGKGLRGRASSTTRPGGLVPAGGAVQNPHLRLSRRVLHHQSFLEAFFFPGDHRRFVSFREHDSYMALWLADSLHIHSLSVLLPDSGATKSHPPCSLITYLHTPFSVLNRLGEGNKLFLWATRAGSELQIGSIGRGRRPRATNTGNELCQCAMCKKTGPCSRDRVVRL